MKAIISYHGEPNAGIPSRYYELDLGDMFDSVMEDEPETREDLRNKLKELAIMADDVPDRIQFDDECECGQSNKELHQCPYVEDPIDSMINYVREYLYDHDYSSNDLTAVIEELFENDGELQSIVYDKSSNLKEAIDLIVKKMKAEELI